MTLHRAIPTSAVQTRQHRHRPGVLLVSPAVQLGEAEDAGVAAALLLEVLQPRQAVDAVPGRQPRQPGWQVREVAVTQRLLSRNPLSGPADKNAECATETLKY